MKELLEYTSLGKILGDLRARTRWLRQNLEGVDSTAVYVIPDALKKRERLLFLVLNESQDAPVTPFHFNLPGSVRFRSVSSLREVQELAMDELCVSDTCMVVILGVLAIAKQKRFNWRVLFDTKGSEESRLVAVREILLEMEAMTREVRERIRSAGYQAVVVQALYDRESNETYWDLEKIIAPERQIHPPLKGIPF